MLLARAARQADSETVEGRYPRAFGRLIDKCDIMLLWGNARESNMARDYAQMFDMGERVMVRKSGATGEIAERKIGIGHSGAGDRVRVAFDDGSNSMWFHLWELTSCDSRPGRLNGHGPHP